MAYVFGIQPIKHEPEGMPLTHRAGRQTLGQGQDPGGQRRLTLHDFGHRFRREPALKDLRQVLDGHAWRNRRQTQITYGQLHLAGSGRINVLLRHAPILVIPRR